MEYHSTWVIDIILSYSEFSRLYDILYSFYTYVCQHLLLRNMITVVLETRCFFVFTIFNMDEYKWKNVNSS